MAADSGVHLQRRISEIFVLNLKGQKIAFKVTNLHNWRLSKSPVSKPIEPFFSKFKRERSQVY